MNAHLQEKSRKKGQKLVITHELNESHTTISITTMMGKGGEAITPMPPLGSLKFLREIN